MIISTKVHTIFMLIGPSECGKTTFAKEILIPGLQFADETRNIRANIQYLSSDQIRQEILGYEHDKYDQVMLEASDQAFQMLFARLKLVTSFPINAEFVVVDTTGLAEDFRAKVKEIAIANQYNLEAIVFDYRKRSDYYASERSKKLITGHLNRLKKEVLGSLSREGYSNIHRIREKNFISVDDMGNRAGHTELIEQQQAYTIVVEDLPLYTSTTLPHQWQYIVIGDVHECVDELKGLLLDYGFKLEGNKITAGDRMQRTKLILLGDWIDKGKQTAQMIHFLYENQDYFYLVIGNHENFISKYLQGEIQGIDEHTLHTYFDSASLLKQDVELQKKFQQLIVTSQPFYRYIGSSSASFYVTHAPCRNKYIGKLDRSSLAHQRNYRIDRDAALEEQLLFLREEAVNNYPFHIFGHVAAKQAFRIGNKLHIDTGCVHGNMLTAATMSYKPHIRTHKSRHIVLDEALPTLFKPEQKIKLTDLADEDIRRLHYCSRHRVNFISGTMSPADKHEEHGELESLERGLDYFRSQGVEQVVLQPKYMGSRCTVYLHLDVEQCFSVSRNGYKIKQVNMTAIYNKLLAKFAGYMRERKIEMLILDGELLPWRVLGEGLIEGQFQPIAKALETELDFLQRFGFEAAYKQLAAEYETSDFAKEQFHVAKNVLKDKYGMHLYQSYKHMHEIIDSYVPLEQHKEAYSTYRRQLELYAVDGELDYKPFALLKVVYEDGREQIPLWTTSEMYAFLSEDQHLMIDLREDNYLEQAEAYYKELTVEKHMEGVVIKPERWNGATVPYMKVRNEQYLSIIYGYDYKFTHKYSKLMKQKNITKKLRASLKEYKLGMSMLEVPFNEINPQNEQYNQIAANLLFEVAQEKELDPRL